MSQSITSTTPLRTFEDHEDTVWAVAVFSNRRRMVTGSDDKTLRIWDQTIQAHPTQIKSVDFSPDGTVLATGSHDGMMKFWCTKTWQMQGDPILCGAYCIRYSPSGELLAIATDHNIQIYNPGTREPVASFKGHTKWNMSLAWTPDGTCLLSGGDNDDPTIREWDSSTWQQVGHPWEGHTSHIYDIAIDPAGTLVASASFDKRVRLWRLSDQRNIGIFQHSSSPQSVTFSVDGRHVLSGGHDKMISEWDILKILNPKILAITTARHACITGDLSTAENLLTRDIHTDAKNYTSYAHRSFVRARKHDWDKAREDAIKSINIQPSLTGYISKGIALYGRGCFREARIAFDVASMFTNQDSDTNHFLLLIKAIALFNAAQVEEAFLLVNELAVACPNADLLVCRVVETYLRVQLGIDAFDGARLDEAADYFNAAVNSSVFSSKFIHQTYEDLTVLFGWDLESFLLTAHQKRCQALLSAGKSDEALEAHKYMMDTIDETAKASCLQWSNEFEERCSALAAQDDRILGSEIPGQEQDDRILGSEIPGQEQDGYDAEPNFFHGMHQHSQNSRPRPQQRHRRLKRLRLALTRSPRPAPPPVPPTAPPPVTITTTFKTHLRHIFTRPPQHATPPVVEVAPGRKFTRLAAVKLPEYKKVDDTRHPSSQQATIPQENDTSDIDSLPDVHWCNAFLCYCSCWSHGRLRMPPRWRLERVDMPRQDGTTNGNHNGVHVSS